MKAEYSNPTKDQDNWFDSMVNWIGKVGTSIGSDILRMLGLGSVARAVEETSLDGVTKESLYKAIASKRAEINRYLTKKQITLDQLVSNLQQASSGSAAQQRAGSNFNKKTIAKYRDDISKANAVSSAMDTASQVAANIGSGITTDVANEQIGKLTELVDKTISQG